MLRVACWQTDQSAEVRTSDRQDDRSRMLGAPTEWRQLLTTQCARVDKLEGHLSQKGWPLETHNSAAASPIAATRHLATTERQRPAARAVPSHGQLSRCALVRPTHFKRCLRPHHRNSERTDGDPIPELRSELLWRRAALLGG